MFSLFMYSFRTVVKTLFNDGGVLRGWRCDRLRGISIWGSSYGRGGEPPQ